MRSLSSADARIEIVISHVMKALQSLCFYDNSVHTFTYSKYIVTLSFASFVGVSDDLRMALGSHLYLVCERIVHSQELVYHKFGLHNITVCYLIDWGNTMIAIVHGTTGVDKYLTVNIYYFSDTGRSKVCSFPFGHSPSTTSRYNASILYWVCFLDLKRAPLV